MWDYTKYVMRMRGGYFDVVLKTNVFKVVFIVSGLSEHEILNLVNCACANEISSKMHCQLVFDLDFDNKVFGGVQ